MLELGTEWMDDEVAGCGSVFVGGVLWRVKVVSWSIAHWRYPGCRGEVVLEGRRARVVTGVRLSM